MTKIILLILAIIAMGWLWFGWLEPRRRYQQFAESKQHFIPHMSADGEFMCVCVRRPPPHEIEKTPDPSDWLSRRSCDNHGNVDHEFRVWIMTAACIFCVIG